MALPHFMFLQELPQYQQTAFFALLAKLKIKRFSKYPHIFYSCKSRETSEREKERESNSGEKAKILEVCEYNAKDIYLPNLANSALSSCWSQSELLDWIFRGKQHFQIPLTLFSFPLSLSNPGLLGKQWQLLLIGLSGLNKENVNPLEYSPYSSL